MPKQSKLIVAFYTTIPYHKTMRLYLHSLLVLGSFLLVFVWQNSQLQTYTVPAIGFLVFMFLLVSIKNKRNLNFGGPANFFLLNSVLLLLIFSTGGISSNLFFILYFLLFGAAFIMDPRSVFMFPLGVVIVFWSTLFTGDTVSNLIKAGSLGFLSPLAYFFGKQFKINEKQEDEVLETKERSMSAAEEISKDVEEVLEKDSDKLDQKDVEKLSDVLEETEDLRSEKNND